MLRIFSSPVKALINKLNYLEKSDKFPLPKIIHLETRAKCNGACSFCGASGSNDKRPDTFMSDILFEKIIHNLSDINFNGRLSLYNNSEALLDNRIFKFISIARKALPFALLEIKTNGILLNDKNLIKLYDSGLDKLCINDYTPSGKLSKRISKLKEKLLSSERFRSSNSLEIYGRLNNEVLGSRAGNSPNKKLKTNPLANQPCFRPSEMMTITPEGNVSVCSEDQYCEFNMGNLINSKIEDIWYSDEWSKIRKQLMNGSRNSNKLCAQCDYRGFSLGLFDAYEIPILFYSYLVALRSRALNFRKIKQIIKRVLTFDYKI